MNASNTNLPSYADLPIRPGSPKGSSWGVWGDDDRFGTLNLLTPERVLRGKECVRTGRVHCVSLELELPDPPLFGRPAFTHEVVSRPSGISSDDMLHGLNTQSSSQWDGFRHVRSAAHGAYNGLDESEHGVHHWARKGIVGRGILADVGRWRAAQGRPVRGDHRDEITPADIAGTLAAQGTTVETGDILLVRTGWLSFYRSMTQAQRDAYAPEFEAPGLLAAEETAAYLWDLHVACIGMDNPAIEAWPPPMFAMTPEERVAKLADSADPAVAGALFLHLLMLPLIGMPLGELFDLDSLADDCASTGTYDFLVTSAPLNLLHGVASPPNILAIR